MQKLFLFFACMLLAGCGTIYSSLNNAKIGEQKIQIHLNGGTEGVKVFVDEQPVPFTNGEIILSKARPAHFVTLKKEGYRPVTQYFSREINAPVAVLDTLLIIPLFIDAANNELFKIEPSDIRVILRKEN